MHRMQQEREDDDKDLNKERGEISRNGDVLLEKQAVSNSEYLYANVFYWFENFKTAYSVYITCLLG